MGQQGRARFGAPKALVVVETEIHDVVWWVFFFFSSRRRHTRFDCDWSSDVCSSDLLVEAVALRAVCRLARPPCGRGGCEQRRPGCVAGAGGLARGRQQCRGSARRCVDRKSTRLNSSHSQISYAVFCLKKKNNSATLPPSRRLVAATLSPRGRLAPLDALPRLGDLQLRLLPSRMPAPTLTVVAHRRSRA